MPIYQRAFTKLDTTLKHYGRNISLCHIGKREKAYRAWSIYYKAILPRFICSTSTNYENSIGEKLELQNSKCYYKVFWWRRASQQMLRTHRSLKAYVQDDKFFFFIFPSNGPPLLWYWQGKTEVLGGNTCSSVTFSSTNPTLTHPGLKPGLQGGRPATNHLRHGKALV
jgi:hypothetical protein